jgi:ethanolamine-phosphate cytidylyltransferase
VDEVIIGAPWVISEELIASMNIQVVVRGTTCDLTDAQGHSRLGLQYDALTASDAREEAYAVPARLGCLVTMPSPKTLTALDIVSRILGQRDMFQARYEKKAASEEVYIKNKTYVQEG